MLELSLRESRQLGQDYIGTEHILLGLVREAEGIAPQVLVSLGVDLSQLRRQIIQLLKSHEGDEDGLRRPFATSRAEDEERLATIGKLWRIEVVVAGRNSDTRAKAYEYLAEMAADLGVQLASVDAPETVVSLVETEQGPGLRLTVEERLAI